MILRLTLLDRGDDQPDNIAVGESIEVPLAPSQSIIIGRAPHADVRVVARSVGWLVVRVTNRDGGVLVEDLGSGGGSAFHGSVLFVGRVAFLVELGS